MAPSPSRQLLHRIALVAFVAMLATGIAMRDAEAIAFAVAVLVGILLLPFRRGLLGRFVLALVLVDAAAWMLPAAFSNVQHHDELAYVAIPVGLAAVAVGGVVAAVGIGSRLVPLLLLLTTAASVAYSQVAAGDHVTRRAGDVALSAKNVRFSRDALEAGGDHVSVSLRNRDLFWHTFTIDALHVDLRVPVGATRRVTFSAPAGTYTYYCRIPGHDAAGMNGQIVVTSSSPSA